MALVERKEPMTEPAIVPVNADLVPAQVSLPTDRNPAAIYLARLDSANSRRAMGNALVTLARLVRGDRCDHSRRDRCPLCDPLRVPWASLRYQHCQALRAALSGRFSASTVNLCLAGLRGVLKEAWRLGLMEAEDYHRAADLAGVRASTLPTGRHLSRREVQQLFGACAKDESAIGRRDAAVLAVLYGGGLRRTEVVGLDVTDFDHEQGALTVRRGKGRKDRLVPLMPGAPEALEDWLAVRGLEPGPLFFPGDGRGRGLVPRRMTAQAIYDLLRRRGSQAKVAEFSPHDMRRSYVSELLDAGADLSMVQRLAGHANVTTTQRYDRRGDEAMARAAALGAVPYHRRKGDLTDR